MAPHGSSAVRFRHLAQFCSTLSCPHVVASGNYNKARSRLSPATLLKSILSFALQTDVDADGNPSPASSGSMSGSSRDASSSSGSSLASTLGLGSSSAGEDHHTHKAQEIINRAVSAVLVMLQCW
jgi:hypothetical protein